MVFLIFFFVGLILCKDDCAIVLQFFAINVAFLFIWKGLSSVVLPVGYRFVPLSGQESGGLSDGWIGSGVSDVDEVGDEMLMAGQSGKGVGQLLVLAVAASKAHERLEQQRCLLLLLPLRQLIVRVK